VRTIFPRSKELPRFDVRVGRGRGNSLVPPNNYRNHNHITGRSAPKTQAITFGLGTSLPPAVLATKVTSGTKMSQFWIFLSMVSVIGGVPGTPCVSESICSSTARKESSVMRLAAFFRTMSIRLRLNFCGVSLCQA